MILQKNKGSAIILVLLILLVLVILGITIFNIDTVHMKILSSEKIHQRAYYYAESGLIQQIELLRSNVDQLYLNSEIASRDSFFLGILDTPIITPEFENCEEEVGLKVTIKKSNDPNVKDGFILFSICTIGKIQRAVRAIVEIKWVDPEDPDFRLDHKNFSIIGWEEVR